MIQLTRINRKPLVLNADLIEYIENTPDTMIRLTSGQTMMVLETVEEIIDRVIQFRQRVAQLPVTPAPEVRVGE